MLTALWILVIVVAFAFGTIIGSFLNVVVWRVPRGESVVSPPSACPHCGQRIKPWDNIPVLSWLLLRAKCRSCKAPISPRYPLVEFGTGLVFAAVVGGGLAGLYPLGLVPALLYLAAITVALTLIDLDTQRLPDAIVLPSYIVLVVLLALASLIEGDWWALLWAAAGGAILFAVYLLIAFIAPRGMGMGDVKLAGVLGLVLGWIGWGALIVGAFSAFLLGGVFGILLVLFRRAGRRSGIPFGPWMFGGAWVGIAAGEALWTGYLRLIGAA